MSNALSSVDIPRLRRNRLVDEVTHTLREMIIDGRLPPGKPLLQVELSEQLGISRTPLREAFRVLENDGLVRSSERNRTVEVVEITPDELREMYQLREVIDGLAARLLAQKGLTQEVRSELEHLLSEMKASSKPYDPARRTAAHGRFHALIAEECGNDQLRSFVPLIRSSSAALYVPFVNDPSAVTLVDEGKLLTHQEVVDAAQEHHEGILAALVDGDGARAETAARRHIARTLRWVDRLDEWKKAIAEASEAAAAAPARQPRATKAAVAATVTVPKKAAAPAKTAVPKKAVASAKTAVPRKPAAPTKSAAKR